MKRRLLNLVTALSLLMCAGYLAAWLWPREGEWPSEVKTLTYARWRIDGTVITGGSVWLDWQRWSSDDGWLDHDFTVRREAYWERCEDQIDLSAAVERLPPRGFGKGAYAFPHGTDIGGRDPNRSWRWWRFRWDWYEDVVREWEDERVIGRRSWGTLYLPAWLPPAVCLALPAARVIPALRRRARRRTGICPACGYDLTGNRSGVCPECGEAMP